MNDYEYINALQASETAPVLTEWEQRIESDLHKQFISSVKSEIMFKTGQVILGIILFIMILLYELHVIRIRSEMPDENSLTEILFSILFSIADMFTTIDGIKACIKLKKQCHKHVSFIGKFLSDEVRVRYQDSGEYSETLYEHYITVQIDKIHAVRNIYLLDQHADKINKQDEILVMYYPAAEGIFHLFGKKI